MITMKHNKLTIEVSAADTKATLVTLGTALVAAGLLWAGNQPIGSAPSGRSAKAIMTKGAATINEPTTGERAAAPVAPTGPPLKAHEPGPAKTVPPAPAVAVRQGSVTDLPGELKSQLWSSAASFRHTSLPSPQPKK